MADNESHVTVTRTKRRRLKYALDRDDEAGVDQPGSPTRAQWNDECDNPLAAGFIPLTDRGERGKARWWALLERRKKNEQTHGVYDP